MSKSVLRMNFNLLFASRGGNVKKHFPLLVLVLVNLVIGLFALPG
jgi:hypothetical protein